MYTVTRIVMIVMLLLIGVFQAQGQQLYFASAEKARQILTCKDEYVKCLSPFDMSARMKTDQTVTLEQFLEHSGNAAMEWQADEQKIVENVFENIKPALAPFVALLPDSIMMIRTNGQIEGGSPYTRSNAVVFTPQVFTLSDSIMQEVLAHELFHVITRAHPQLKRQLYKSIGFHYCGEIKFPEMLKARKMTNPDAPFNDHCIQVSIADEQKWVVPILYSRTDKYNTQTGGDIFRYMFVAFLMVDYTPGDNGTGELYDPQNLKLATFDQLEGFYEQVGHNTEYIIHPEETLADNFSLMILGVESLPSPGIIEKIRQVLINFKM